MHKLVAIQPTAFSGYHDLKALFGWFGFHEGRFVAEYPKRWKKLVYEHLVTLPDAERKRAIELLRISVERGKTRGCQKLPYSPEADWIGNARGRYVAGDVSGVIVARNSASDFPSPDVDDEYFFGIGGRQDDVPSTSDGYADAASVLLKDGHELAIIDPYLSSFREGYKKTLTRFAEVARDGKCRRFVCYSIDRSSSLDEIKRERQDFFPKHR